VKYGKNASDTCALLSEAYGGEDTKKIMFLSGANGSKTGGIAYNFLRYQGYCSLWMHSTTPNSQPSLLCGNTEAVTWSCA